MSDAQMDRDIAAYRSFNRFFTRKIGILRDGLLGSPFSLTEARILYEIAQAADTSASALCRELGLDPGYLSRVLGRFEERGLVARVAAGDDNRRRVLSLTEEGRAEFFLLDSRSREESGRILEELAEGDRMRLIRAMGTIEEVLGADEQVAGVFVLRDPEPGDLGWVVQRHGAVYAREYGWGRSFEAIVARIVADFAAGQDPRRERCWIADIGGDPVGCVFLVKADESTAKLRLLLVEPRARGLGLGRRLVDECIRFARGHGYSKLTLWTNSVLVAARSIYSSAGFVLVASEPNDLFGHGLVSETWELELSSPA
jgi:DNA-binding MarR family transcriptional regulator